MSRDNDQLSKSGALEGRQKPEHWLQMMEWSKQPENWSRPTTAFFSGSRPTTACTGINRPATAWTTDTLREHNDSSVTLVPLVPGRDVEHSQKMPYFNEQTKYLTRRRIIMVFAGCALVNFGAFLDQTSLAAAHVVVGRALNAGDNMTWITGAYFVTSTACQLLYGRLSDVFSRKVVLLSCIAIFFLGSLASSLAQNAMQLILFRALTGIGGGGLVTGSQMIVSDVVPLRERGKYQGILASAMAIANAVGPILGGVLASQSPQSWRWIFRLNLSLTAFMVLAVTFFMPLRRVQGSWKAKLQAIDFFGALLALAGSVVLTLGLTWAGGQHPWVSVQVVSTLAVGGFLSALFVLWQWKGAKFPLIPMHVFKSKLVCGGCITMFIHGWLFMVQMFYIPTLYQLVYGFSATEAGLLLLPVTLAQPFCGSVSGAITSWTARYKENMCIGWALWSIGLGLLSTITKGSTLAERIGFASLTGIGAGLTLQSSLIAMQAGVERKEMAVITSFRNFIRNFGSTLGLAATATMINNSVQHSFKSAGLSTTQAVLRAYTIPSDDKTREALISGYQSAFRAVFITLAVLGALAFFLALILIPQVSLKRPDDNKFKEIKPWKDIVNPAPPGFLPPKAALILGISKDPKCAFSV